MIGVHCKRRYINVKIQYAEAKEMKSLTLHTHGCPISIIIIIIIIISLRDCSSSKDIVPYDLNHSEQVQKTDLKDVLD